MSETWSDIFIWTDRRTFLAQYEFKMLWRSARSMTAAAQVGLHSQHVYVDFGIHSDRRLKHELYSSQIRMRFTVRRRRMERKGQV